jgi:alanine-glyoxylate transaminase/serine-glyoxylate transaminase/serine-pyruvate transaminase
VSNVTYVRVPLSKRVLRLWRLELHAQEGHRACSLATVRIPSGVDGQRLVQRLLKEYNIEIGVGLGPLKGKIWHIGLMGYSSTEDNVFLILSALERLLLEEGYQLEPGSGIMAAAKALNSQ